MDTFYPMRTLVSFVIIAILLPRGHEAQKTRLNAKNGVYLVNLESLTRNEAEEACKQEAILSGTTGRLAMPSSKTLDDELNDILLKYFDTKTSDAEWDRLRKYWIGGFEESAAFGKTDYPVWRWLEGMKELYGQGCFEDNFRQDRRDMIALYTFQDSSKSPTGTTEPMTISNCTNYCLNNNYEYAGVQGGRLCFCDDTYGSYGVTSGCTTLCSASSANSGIAREFCGGSYRNFVYKLKDAAYSNWGYDQPNNFEGYQVCGALESRHNWKMGDDACFTEHYYICQISIADCPTTNYKYELVGGKCLYYGMDTAQNWFKAREACATMNGDLATISSEGMFLEVQRKLNKFKLTSSAVWVGLIGREWSWDDGTKFLYTNWDPIEPDQDNGNCIVYQYNYLQNYWWVDANCAEKLPSVCHIDRIPVPTVVETITPSSTPANGTGGNTVKNSNPTSSPTLANSNTTSDVTTKTIQSTASPTDPNIGASTVNSGIGQLELVLLIVLGVVVLIVIIILIVLCCLTNGCKSKKKNTVAPKDVTDLRNQVFIPFGDYYGNYGNNDYDYISSRPSSGEQILNPTKLHSKSHAPDNSFRSDRQQVRYHPSRSYVEDDYFRSYEKQTRYPSKLVDDDYFGSSGRQKPSPPRGPPKSLTPDDSSGSYRPAGLARLGSNIDEERKPRTEGKKKKKSKQKKYNMDEFQGRHGYRELSPIDGTD